MISKCFPFYDSVLYKRKEIRFLINFFDKTKRSFVVFTKMSEITVQRHQEKTETKVEIINKRNSW